MAEAAALTSIARSALQLFTSLAEGEFLLLWHSREDLERLRVTIETIGDFLLDSEERKLKDRSMQRCLSNLKKAMYDAEDLFDALAAHVLRKKTTPGNAFTKEVNIFFSKSNQLGFFVKTAHEVKSLRKSLDAISRNMQQFSFIHQQQNPPLDQLFTTRKTHSFVHLDDIIGRDEDKARIIDMLIPPDKGETSCHQSVSVVAIVGFGGLGKTALAQFVYNDERVKQGFDVHLWACINYLSNLEQVLKEIIASKVERKQLDLSVEMLQEKLRDIIGGKKFFIVLDDLWDKSTRNWLDLETILRCGRSGSKILVTTRSREVAKCVNAIEPYCDLSGLSDESAWSLFQKKAFHGEEPSDYPELEPIGKKILNKCGNVPLAIVTIASLLAQKRRDERAWTEFYENQLKEVLSSSTDDSLKQVLMVSYNDLHPNLKPCFATCSLFPKDYHFGKGELIRLWLAQGILKPCGNNKRSLEEVGEAYFFQLVDRCFFQEVQYYEAWVENCFYVGNKEHRCTAKMHDLLHDIAIEVAKTENLFLPRIPKSNVEIDGLRHISIAFDLDDFFNFRNLVVNTKIVRTLLFCCQQNTRLTTLKPLLTSFTMLRTLHLSSLQIDGVPESIGGLIHLRYLDLSYNANLKHLPDSICKLHHLMVFVLEGCRLLEKLPQRIGNLVSLRQLCIDGCDNLDCLPLGLKALTSLVTLDRLIVHSRDGGLGYLKDLDNLAGTLGIELPEEGWVDAIEDVKKANMARKNKLKEIVIQWKQRCTTTGEQKMAKDEAKAVLEALQPHENLEYLVIQKYGGEMLSSWLWTLKYVKELCLEDCDQVEYLEDGIQSHLCLPSLKILWIQSMRNLKGWWREEMAQGTSPSHLSTVSCLAIRDCPKLKGQMPIFDEIEYLSLSRVDAKVVESVLVPKCFDLSPFYSSNKLMELGLDGIEGLNSLPEGWMRHLTALHELNIENCMELRWVSRRGLAHLTALKRLFVHCGEIGEEDDELDKMGNERGMPWKVLEGLENLTVGFGHKTFRLPEYGVHYLPSLRSLHLIDCKELYMSWKTLLVNMKLIDLSFIGVERVIDVEEDQMMVVEPHQLQLSFLGICGWAKWVDEIPWFSLSSSLQLLAIDGGKMEQLPDGIRHLTALQRLEIDGCEKFRSLPVWIPTLTSLNSLKIWGCSDELNRRCRRETGEDWPLIKHIPCTSITTTSEHLNCDLLNESREKEDEEDGNRKLGWCGGLSLSKFHRRLL